jgi:ketosteroid isomerase-like protein
MSGGISATRGCRDDNPRVASNVERLRGLFARFNDTGELDFAAAHPDLELHDRPDVPDGRVWRGIDGVRAFFEKTAESFDPIRWEPREYIAAGRHVVVRAHVVAYGAASGTPIEVDEAQLWTFEDGLLIRLQAFPTIEDAYATARALDEAEGIEPPLGG